MAYVDTRVFWPDADQTPEPGFGFHWYNNAERFLRIGAGLGDAMIDLIGGDDQGEDPTDNQDSYFCSYHRRKSCTVSHGCYKIRCCSRYTGRRNFKCYKSRCNMLS